MPQRLDAELSLAGITQLRKRDPTLAAVIDKVGPFRLKCETNRYQSLLRAIIGQQISSSAARSIWGRIQDAVPSHRMTPEAIGAMSDEELRACGVSPQKLGYVRSLTEHVLDKSLPLHRLHRDSDDDVVEQLIQVKGIGVWTAQMFLMFSLGRPDVLPHGDLGIQSAIRNLYGLPELPKRMECEQIAEPWRPYATIACWYLWRSTETW